MGVRRFVSVRPKPSVNLLRKLVSLGQTNKFRSLFLFVLDDLLIANSAA